MVKAEIDAAHSSRDRLFDGFLSRAELEAETGWGWRTILRREAEGLPVIVVGGTKLYPAEQVREWLLSHLRAHNPPRVGRPKKGAL